MNETTEIELDEQVGARNVAPSWASMALFVLGLIMTFCAVAAITVNRGV